jgi:hypothetical protein
MYVVACRIRYQAYEAEVLLSAHGNKCLCNLVSHSQDHATAHRSTSLASLVVLDGRGKASEQARGARQ